MVTTCLLVDAASSGFTAVDRAGTPTGAERVTIEIKLAVGAIAAIAGPAGLALITARRGHRMYARVWTTVSVLIAAMVVLMMFSLSG